mmetsp:Transcript_12860/g.16799  ORF Transcript_12860/g.16799 Transcript_12860/m.16799 type:complete len:220 (+) Transcript_12860:376-1035(+)
MKSIFPSSGRTISLDCSICGRSISFINIANRHSALDMRNKGSIFTRSFTSPPDSLSFSSLRSHVSTSHFKTPKESIAPYFIGHLASFTFLTRFFSNSSKRITTPSIRPDTTCFSNIVGNSHLFSSTAPSNTLPDKFTSLNSLKARSFLAMTSAASLPAYNATSTGSLSNTDSPLDLASKASLKALIAMGCKLGRIPLLLRKTSPLPASKVEYRCVFVNV